MTWICLELVVLWMVLPILLWADTLPVVYRISILVMAAAYALWIVWFEEVRWDELGFRGLTGLLPSLVLGAAWIAASLLVLALAAIVLHGLVSLGAQPTTGPESLLALLLFYASVSVTSQEFLYSSFFFWRYRPLFSPGFLVGLNALVFAVAHLVYHSWVSVVLALAGRVIMARIYRRYGSFWGCGPSTSSSGWRSSSWDLGATSTAPRADLVLPANTLVCS